ncbi:HAD domain-containing protein [Leifsonia xyli]|uniref:HAD domain-containing protein n=1 Tax=Leifsonia xyli TaxID=1575 RepID=UPI003D66EA1F
MLLVFDIDGTVSPIHPPKKLASRYTMHSYLPVDERLIAALDVLAGRPTVSVAWLTSWSSDSVAWLIDQLGGRLDGPYIPHTPDWATRAAGWRARSLLRYLEHASPDVLIWADDDAGNDVNQRRLDRAGYRHRHLLFQPDKNVGLTLADVDQMNEFVQRFEDRLRLGSNQS